MQGSPLLPALLGLGLLTACAGSTQITTRYAPDFAHTPHTVSVLGVFKDGRMNADAWAQLGPGLSASLGGRCQAGYDALASTNQGLSAAIDDVARANGVGDDLLERLAPAATGDLVLLVTVAGQVATGTEPGPDTSLVAGGPPVTGGNKYRGMSVPRGPTGSLNKNRPITDGTAFEIALTLYSVSQRRSVGSLQMLYNGPSVDDAVARISARMREELPGSTCSTWNWSAPIDEHAIRELVER